MRRAIGCDPANVQNEAVDRVEHRLSLCDHGDPGPGAFEMLPVRPAGLVKERHTCFAVRMLDDGYHGSRIESVSDLRAVRAREFAELGQPDVAPLAVMVAFPTAVLASTRQPPAQGYSEQRRNGRQH